MVICGTDNDIEWPDVGNAAEPCCWGSLHDGPTGCTCWQPDYDLDQDVQRLQAPGLRSTPCDDCAYRGGSPERQGSDVVQGDGSHLAAIVVLNRPFFCHQGIRRPVRFRHPSGVEYTPPNLDVAYRPPIHHGIPYKADGTPADICAGWAAARLRSTT
jgi:hypothetical protein